MSCACQLINYTLQSSHYDFENRSKNADCQKNLEFYHTFLLALLKKVGVRIKKLEYNNPNLELVRILRMLQSLSNYLK